MAGKSTLPLLLAAGVGAIVLTKGKKKKRKPASPASPTEPKPDKDGVVASGSVDRVFAAKSPTEGFMPYEWRVRKKSGDYIAEVGMKTPRDLKVGSWEEVGKADNMEDAKELAFAYIDKQPGFEFASTVVKSGSQRGAFDYIVREGEYVEVEGEGFSGSKTETIEGYIGEYRINGTSKWVEASKGQDMDRVRVLTLEAATIASAALGGGDTPEWPQHMLGWMAACEGEISMQDMGPTIGVVPYCPAAKSGQTVTSGSSEGGDRLWRIQKTANNQSPYVVQNNLSGDWEFVDSDVTLSNAIIKGYNSIV